MESLPLPLLIEVGDRRATALDTGGLERAPRRRGAGGGLRRPRRLAAAAGRDRRAAAALRAGCLGLLALALAAVLVLAARAAVAANARGRSARCGWSARATASSPAASPGASACGPPSARWSARPRAWRWSPCCRRPASRASSWWASGLPAGTGCCRSLVPPAAGGHRLVAARLAARRGLAALELTAVLLVRSLVFDALHLRADGGHGHPRRADGALVGGRRLCRVCRAYCRAVFWLPAGDLRPQGRGARGGAGRAR